MRHGSGGDDGIDPPNDCDRVAHMGHIDPTTPHRETNGHGATARSKSMAHVGHIDPTPPHRETNDTTTRSKSIVHIARLGRLDEANTSGRATSIDCADNMCEGEATTSFDGAEHVGVDDESGTSATSIDCAAHVGRVGEDAEFEATIRTPPQRRSNYQWVVMKTEATRALAQAGFKSKARSLVEHAAANAPPDITLEELIRAALRVSLAES